MSVIIHPTAVVDPGAELGKDVAVGPFCIVEQDVAIGDGTTLDACSQVKAHTRMGRGNRLHTHAIVGGEPQDLKFHGEKSLLEVGDNNVFREFCTIHRGTENGGGVTRIGNGGLFMAYVHVAHDCILGDGVIMSNASSLAGHVVIGDHVIIGGMCGVHQFVHVGEFGFVGAMSGLGQDLPPYMLASGARARLHGLNLIGLRRRGFPAEALSALKKAYKTIFRSGRERQEALASVMEEFGAVPQVAKLVDFIRGSARGIVTPAVRGDNGDDTQD